MPIKIFAFDLNIHDLEKFYPRNDYTYAYTEIGRFLHENGFEHKQYSGYISKKPMNDLQVIDLIKKLSDELPWVGKCCESVLVTDKPQKYMEFSDMLKKLSQKYYVNKFRARKPCQIPDKQSSKSIQSKNLER